MMKLKFRAKVNKSHGEKKTKDYFVYWEMGARFDEDLLLDGYDYIDFRTVCMYIGQKDKNKKEIYWGDILKTDEAGWIIGKVAFNNASFYLVDDFDGFSYEPDWEKCEVIGNIFTNPKLFEGF